VRDILKRRAQSYTESGRCDSGFDLEVYVNGNEMTPVVDGWVLLTTQVHAKVIRFVVDEPMTAPVKRLGAFCAFKLMARSSLPRTGWMLGNSVGLVDMGYCDPLKASLVRHGHNTTAWTTLCQQERPIVQIVAPDDQPFDAVTVCESDEEWIRYLSYGVTPDRGGGFGSTDRNATTTTTTTTQACSPLLTLAE
jgi:dUTPase